MDGTPERNFPETIEADTVAAAAAGDQSALRQVYEITSDRVFGLMIRMVGVQDADDLTQQTFVQAFAKMSQFGGDSKFETWLYRLATNEAL
jgi:RNA polymerase sigma-70 factor (ECF subfamily)